MFRFMIGLVFPAFCLIAPNAVAQTVVVGFEDLPNAFTAAAPGTGGYSNGQHYTYNPGTGTYTSPTTFTSYGAPGVGATFNTSYNPNFSTSSRWSSSSVFNNITGDFTNQYAAYNVAGSTGQNGSDGSASYGIANGGSSTIALAAGYRINSIDITNTTYAYTVIRDGNQFSRAFGTVTQTNDGRDFFKLTITGKNSGGGITGTKEFFLADYRSDVSGEDYIVDHWTTVDLSNLGADTTTLSFAYTSTDVGQFGSNTPAYFAADNLVLTPVPEPGSILLAAGGAGLLLRWRRRQSNGSAAAV